MIEDFNKLKNILVENNSFLLTTHVNPDADAIGSEIAMFEILKSLGKKEIYIVNTSSTPYNLVFLDKEKIIQQYDVNKHSSIIKSVDVLIGLDFNRSDRVTYMREDFLNSSKIKIIIDHHQDPEEFVNYSFVYPEYSATGHIIYDFLRKTSVTELSYPLLIRFMRL